MAQITLLIDSSFPVIQVGLLKEKEWLMFYHREKPALEAIFEGVDGCLNKIKASPQAINRLVLCEGPGSMLALRVATMFVNTWLNPLFAHKVQFYAYYSLCAQAALLIKSGKTPPFHLIAYFRSGLWSHLAVTDRDKFSSLNCITTEAIDSLKGKCFWLDSGKKAQPPSIPTEKISYDLRNLPTVLNHPELLHCKEKPAIFIPAKTPYAQWKKDRHRVLIPST